MVKIRIDCDRPTRPFDRLIVLLQPEISTTFAAIPKCRILIVRTEPYRLVEKFDGLLILSHFKFCMAQTPYASARLGSRASARSNSAIASSKRLSTLSTL